MFRLVVEGGMNCVSVRCDILFKICCLEYAINHEGVECDL